MIKVHSLSKNFNNFLAVDQVSFEVQKGEVLGFLGPNGAGKSTTMKMLTCFIHQARVQQKFVVSAFGKSTGGSQPNRIPS